MSRRVLAAVTLLQMVFWVLLLLPESAGGQAFWAKESGVDLVAMAPASSKIMNTST